MDACPYFFCYNKLMPKDLIVPYTTIDGRRRTAPSLSVMAADRLIKKKLEMKSDNDVWEVFDEVIKIWMELRPSEYQSSIVTLADTKETLSDPVYGTVSKKKTKGTGDLRRTLDVPVFIEVVMHKLFTPDELPFNKEWYEAVWKKYPMFRVSEKI